mmetsp:Transcript_31001/g.73544  ORF Transcript_31001/g.73544 Transcript_31001/m.73544 type:complete len:240 (+) Transcript_31001:1145-1864(+)
MAQALGGAWDDHPIPQRPSAPHRAGGQGGPRHLGRLVLQGEGRPPALPANGRVPQSLRHGRVRLRQRPGGRGPAGVHRLEVRADAVDGHDEPQGPLRCPHARLHPRALRQHYLRRLLALRAAAALRRADTAERLDGQRWRAAIPARHPRDRSVAAARERAARAPPLLLPAHGEPASGGRRRRRYRPHHRRALPRRARHPCLARRSARAAMIAQGDVLVHAVRVCGCLDCLLVSAIGRLV